MTKKEFTKLCKLFSITVDKALENNDIYDTLANMRIGEISNKIGKGIIKTELKKLT